MCRGEGSPTVILEAGDGNDADIWDTVALGPDSRDGGAARCRRLHPRLRLRPSRDDRSTSITAAAAIPCPCRAPRRDASLTCTPCWARPRSPVPMSWPAIPSAAWSPASTPPPTRTRSWGWSSSMPRHEDYYARLQAALTPEQWAAFARPAAGPPDLADDPDRERIDPDASAPDAGGGRRPRYARCRWSSLPTAAPGTAACSGLPPPTALETALAAAAGAQAELAALVPDGRLVSPSRAGTSSRGDQPELVIDAIRAGGRGGA